jgi:hypothetical protein
MRCTVCNYPIKAGQLYVPLVKALDDDGTEAPIEGERLAMHAPPCPAIEAGDL